MSDNGLEFQNDDMRRMMEIFEIEMSSTGADSPWSNGICEWMVGLIKEGIKTVKGEESISRQ